MSDRISAIKARLAKDKANAGNCAYEQECGWDDVEWLLEQLEQAQNALQEVAREYGEVAARECVERARKGEK